MVKIWAKTLINEKIDKSFLFEKQEEFSIVDFVDYVIEICTTMDIPTPLMLKYHLKNFFDFNNVSFSKNDFIEEVDFDEFLIKNSVILD